MNNSIHPEFVDFDIIGDIHGHSNDLKKLLQALGYSLEKGYYKHPTRKVLFVGDYIDRGINVVEVLQIVKAMVDNNQAIALMGNHEYNALCYHKKDKQGKYLREHNKKNYNQHAVTLMAFMKHPQLYQMYIDWFYTLPLYYENSHFRAIHACWDTKSIEVLESNLTNKCLTPELLIESSNKSNPLHQAIEISLKGKELRLPDTAQPFYDHDRVLRRELRIKWWKTPQSTTYESLSASPVAQLPTQQIKVDHIEFYHNKDKPVFFGHYWLEYNKQNKPDILASNACCLDYSVAKSGTLMSYRYQGEQILSPNKLNYIK